MYSRPGYCIGDAWYYVDGDTAHCYYLTEPNTFPENERGTRWDIGHAVSTDLINWDYVGIALAKGQPGQWDDRRLATGCVIRREGRYWMSYTGHRRDESPHYQRVGMAVSDDLTTWEKLPENPVTQSDPRWYEIGNPVQPDLIHWRDPFMLDLGDRVLHYICTRRSDGDGPGRGSVGLAQSQDMRSWQVLPPPEHDYPTDELEVPQVYRIGAHYYLVFCSHPHHLAPEFTAKFPGHPFRSADYSMVGDSPTGPFRMYGTGEILPPDFEPHIYASQLVNWKGEWVLLGTIMGKVGICDPIPIRADETGIHLAE